VVHESNTDVSALQGEERGVTDHRIGTREEWLEARAELLDAEKELTRLGDTLAQRRRDLPWLAVDTDYRFDTVDGEKALVDLFEGRGQLLLYHFMFGPSYEAGDPVNSSIADAVNGVLPHLHARDVTFTFVSQGPLDKLEAYRRRMGWAFPWVSSAPSDFNSDLGFSHTPAQGHEAADLMSAAGLPPVVLQNARSAGTDVVGYLTESPGFSAFVREGRAVYQTYSTTWRGLEFLMSYYAILDRAPRGRDEGKAWQTWLRRHDEYEGASSPARAGLVG
jgi:predicted dithiol-disulfide oxidoreductase (DUF899 family)